MRLLPVALWLLPEAATDVMQCKITLSHYVKICLCLCISNYYSLSMYISFTKATEEFLITVKLENPECLEQSDSHIKLEIAIFSAENLACTVYCGNIAAC